MKKISGYYSVLALLAAAVLTACVPTEKTAVNVAPDTAAAPISELDLDQLYTDTVETFEDTEAYVYVRDFILSGDAKQQTIVIQALCMEETEPEDAEHFLAAVLRRAADCAVNQMPSLRPSSEEDFGGLWESYSFVASFFREKETDKSFYELSVSAGEEIPLDPAMERYEEEWEKTREVYSRTTVYDLNGNVVTK